MTQAKAQTVASALLALGIPLVVERDNGGYTISVYGREVPAAQVSAFATAQGVTALVNNVKFS